MLELRARPPHIDGLRLGRLELGLCLQNIRPRDDAPCVSTVGQLYGSLKLHDSCVEQLFLRIEGSELKVVLRQLGPGAQSGVFEIRGAGLSAGLAGLHKATDPPPDIYFPRSIDSHCK